MTIFSFHNVKNTYTIMVANTLKFKKNRFYEYT